MDRKITDSDLVKIANILPSWKVVARLLGVEGEIVKDIEHRYRDGEDQRLEALIKWIIKNGPLATYGKLYDVLREVQQGEAAEKVKELSTELIVQKIAPALPQHSPDGAHPSPPEAHPPPHDAHPLSPDAPPPDGHPPSQSENNEEESIDANNFVMHFSLKKHCYECCLIVLLLAVYTLINKSIEQCTPNGGLGPSAHLCANTGGLFSCSCPTGYACSDINECAPNGGLGPCAQICNNTPGSFTCGCNEGYSLSEYACNDINECAPNGGKGPCDQICTNTPGSFACGCNAGYTLSGNACKVTGLKICFKELEGSSQCQQNRDSCSSLSSDPNRMWTLPFRDDTDDRSGGCEYVWSLVGIPRQDMVYRVCFKEIEGSSQCQKNRYSCSGWTNSPSWSLPYRDDTNGRSGGCTYQWIIEEQLISQSLSISACRVCFLETEGTNQCQGSREQTCSGWSTSPAFTSTFRDDTDNRSGGCTYQWMLECRSI